MFNKLLTFKGLIASATDDILIDFVVVVLILHGKLSNIFMSDISCQMIHMSYLL